MLHRTHTENYSLFIWNSNWTGCLVFYLASLLRGLREASIYTSQRRGTFRQIVLLNVPGLGSSPQLPFILTVAYMLEWELPRAERAWMAWTEPSSGARVSLSTTQGQHLHKCISGNNRPQCSSQPCKPGSELMIYSSTEHQFGIFSAQYLFRGTWHDH